MTTTTKAIEECQPGDELDMGIFMAIDPRQPDQGPNTVNVRLANGYHYTETAGAQVAIHTTPPIGWEAMCTKCEEAFNPNDENDLEHCVRQDGTECGGQGVMTGSWG